MDNLWLLTEERPKPSVIAKIVEIYCNDFNDRIIYQDEVKIKPLITNGFFTFRYIVEGLKVEKADKILIKTVSGNSSFIDFLLFKQEEEPVEGSESNNLIMAVEETKTSDDESRNTGVYQRGSKFVFIKHYYPDVKLYMLYNDELEERNGKVPSQTSIFGTNILLTLGIIIIGKQNTRFFKPFESLDELIDFKSRMRRPPEGNVPILIEKDSNKIKISGRLSKPSEAGNIGHDPNIGALSMISACVRKLGWNKDIIITQHGVSQSYIDRTNGNNKFLYICEILDLKLDGVSLPSNIFLPDKYWHYECNSEKVADILLHMQLIYNGMKTVYENHAGCERGYFKTKTGDLIALPKKDASGENLYLPDVVLYDKETNNIVIIEGKTLDNIEQGLLDIQNYDSIENEYIRLFYKGANIHRFVSIFGGNLRSIPNNKILFYLSQNGKIIVNANAPECIKRGFEGTNISLQRFAS